MLPQSSRGDAIDATISSIAPVTKGLQRSRRLQQLLAANLSLAPSTSSSSADSNFLSQLQLTSEERLQMVADKKEFLEEEELAHKAQQSIRAALEQQRQSDAVVEKA